MPKLKPDTIMPTALEDEAIDAGIAMDPDTFEVSDEDVAAMRPLRKIRHAAPVKSPVTMRLDADLLGALRASGPGWQTRVNTVLKKAVRSGQL